MPKVRDFELLVILAILRQGDQSYANRVREDLEANAERRVTRGALYRTLDRLEVKGFIRWELEPSEVPERGGHPMRRLEVTADGLAAARSQGLVLQRFFAGLELGGTGRSGE
ncbi:MAG: helix-turn-helix transcriptional regulator [Acidobacteriota bacterium]